MGHGGDMIGRQVSEEYVAKELGFVSVDAMHMYDRLNAASEAVRNAEIMSQIANLRAEVDELKDKL